MILESLLESTGMSEGTFGLVLREHIPMILQLNMVASCKQYLEMPIPPPHSFIGTLGTFGTVRLISNHEAFFFSFWNVRFIVVCDAHCDPLGPF